MENKEEEREKELWDWLRKDERFYSAVDIFNFPETGRGLKALRDINDGEEVMRIPSSYLFTVRNIPTSPLFSQLPRDYFPPSFSFPISQDEEEEEWWRKERGENGEIKEEGGIKGLFKQPFFALVFLLMYEKITTKSNWEKMINLMPTYYESIYHWDQSDLEGMKNTSYPTNDIIENAKLLRKVYAMNILPALKSLPNLFDISQFSIDLFYWAVSSIWSRGYWIDDLDHYPALVPLADMFNHFTLSSFPVVADYKMEGDCFVIKVLRSYKAGEQVWISYGNKSNAEWLNDYGFVYENNDHNAFRFTVPLIKLHPLTSPQLNQQKLNLLSAKNLLSPVFYLEKDKVPYDLLTSLRIRLFDHIELLSAAGNQVDENSDDIQFTTQISLAKIDEVLNIKEGISYRNEFMVYEYLVSQLNSVMENLSATAEEEDREYSKLNNTNFTLLSLQEQRRLFSLRYRREEKFLLDYLMPYFTPIYQKLKHIEENRRNNVIPLYS